MRRSPEASEAAIEIDRAHKLVRVAMGTPLEVDARKYLAAVVAHWKAQRGQP